MASAISASAPVYQLERRPVARRPSRNQVVLKKLSRDLFLTYKRILSHHQAKERRRKAEGSQKTFREHQAKCIQWGLGQVMLNLRGEPCRGAYGAVHLTKYKNVVVKISRPIDSQSITSAKAEIAALRILTLAKAPHSVRQLDASHFVQQQEFCSFQTYAGNNLFEKHLDCRNPKMRKAGMQGVERIAKQFLEYLVFLEKHNMIHGDLKPSNAGSDQYGNVRVFDLNLARFLPLSKRKLFYSRWYRAPEAILRMWIGTPSDMWALGCILHELYTGNSLFFVNDHDLEYRDNQIHFHRFLQRLGIPNRNLEETVPQEMLTVMERRQYVRVRDGHYTLRSRTEEHWRPFSASIRAATASTHASKEKVTLFIDLLTRMLKLDPRKRISPADALNHPFFHTEQTDVSFTLKVRGNAKNLWLRVTDYQAEILQVIPLSDPEACYHLLKSKRPYLFQIYNRDRPLNLSIRKVPIIFHLVYHIDTSHLQFRLPFPPKPLSQPKGYEGAPTETNPRRNAGKKAVQPASKARQVRRDPLSLLRKKGLIANRQS